MNIPGLKIPVIVYKKDEQYHAFLRDRPGLFATGESQKKAITALISSIAKFKMPTEREAYAVKVVKASEATKISNNATKRNLLHFRILFATLALTIFVLVVLAAMTLISMGVVGYAMLAGIIILPCINIALLWAKKRSAGIISL